MVRAAKENGIRYDWIGGDGLYGHDSKFRDALADDGESYVLDGHANETGYLEPPCPSLPTTQSGRGRPPTRYQVDREGITVKELVREGEDACFKASCFRDGRNGGKRRNVWVHEVYTWNGEEVAPRTERVLVSQHRDGTEVKSSRCHEQAKHSSWCDLLYMQMQRFWVEQRIKDAKSELGLSEYQVRTWRAWHHHMTVTMLALLFMLQQKLSHHEESPLLSCSNIRFILAHTLPQKIVSKDDVLNMIEQRHHRRQYDLDRYAES